MRKIILDLCGGTAAWSKPYAEAGYDVRNITLPEYDVKTWNGYLNIDVHGILAAPPCTHLAGCGAPFWKEKGTPALLEALSIVDACLRVVIVCRPKFWALENPVGRLTRYLGRPKMYFNPCDYGDPWTKKTALWGDFNEPKKNPVKPSIDLPKNSPHHNQDVYFQQLGILPKKFEDRGEVRSVTPPHFAKAFFEANP